MFNQAIAAVAVCDASKNYLKSVAKPDTLPERDYKILISEIARAAVEAQTKRAAEAREALARVIQYEPKVKLYYEDAAAVTSRADEIIGTLIEARAALR